MMNLTINNSVLALLCQQYCSAPEVIDSVQKSSIIFHIFSNVTRVFFAGRPFWLLTTIANKERSDETRSDIGHKRRP